MLKCPKCGKQLVEFEMVEEKEIMLFCQDKNCGYKTTDKKTIRDIKDIAMMDEDHEIWKSVQKYR